MGEQESRISKRMRLAQVLDLNGLLDKVFHWAVEHTGPWDAVFSSYSPDARADEKEIWLDRQLGKSRRDQERFMSAALSALGAYAAEQPYQPTWATLWEDLERNDTGAPERWLELLGMRSTAERQGAGKSGTSPTPWAMRERWPGQPSSTQASIACTTRPHHSASLHGGGIRSIWQARGRLLRLYVSTYTNRCHIPLLIGSRPGSV